MPKINDEIISKLHDSIADDVGVIKDGDIEGNSLFNKSLNNALAKFNSSIFDKDGFIRKMSNFETGSKEDNSAIKNILRGIKNDHLSAESLNHSELLLRYDLYNIVNQMPEMHDVINIVRDSIIEANTSTGRVSRTIVFENIESDERLDQEVREIERKYDLLNAIKNFIIPNTLMHGEMYVLTVPYAKIFAELSAIKETNNNFNEEFKESVPTHIQKSFNESRNLFSNENVEILMESISSTSASSYSNEFKVENDSSVNIDKKIDKKSKDEISSILKNIEIHNQSSILVAEMGPQAAYDFIVEDYKKYNRFASKKDDYTHFSEAVHNFNMSKSMFKNIDQDRIDIEKYEHIKGIYIRYLSGLKVVPIRIDRKIIGYYYISTTKDFQNTSAIQQNGMIDMNYNIFTKDRRMVDSLAEIIIKSFDTNMIKQNIQLKNEIIEVLMAHKFHEGRLSFVYIPETDIQRIAINEDEGGKGHSILEKSLFAARSYLILNMYNMLYTLNNNTTRVHYIKSSGLDKNYAATIERAMRKFQSRRINIDDIYSYTGVLNKIGGMGEMVLPAGRNDYKALETDTIPAVDNPINIEFIEQRRREAISGTGVPNLMIINAIDEIDFAKTLEMANTRFLSTVSSFKLDFALPITKLYQVICKWDSSMSDTEIQSLRFQFNTIKQSELVITADMIQNFLQVVDVIGSMCYKKEELEDSNGNPTRLKMRLMGELAKEYLPQLNFDKLEEIIDNVNILALDDTLKDKIKDVKLTDNDIEELNK